MNFQQEALTALWKKEIEQHLGKPVEVQHIGIVSGGSISPAYKINTNAGAYFVKTNLEEKYPKMFELEAKGLEFLASHSNFKIPTAIGTGVTEGTQWLLMEFIVPGLKSPDFWEDFGANLANLHKPSQDSFGLGYDNYFGSMHQKNAEHKTWAQFFVENRMEPQLKLAMDQNRIRPEIARRCERLFNKLDTLVPIEPAAAVHGDLWSGNYMTDAAGNATVFDPAVYYGHREVDIAMTRLFSSLDEQFYKSYNTHFPLEKGWEERCDIFNLYPLFAHINLFGESGYLSQVTSILRTLV